MKTRGGWLLRVTLPCLLLTRICYSFKLTSEIDDKLLECLDFFLLLIPQVHCSNFVILPRKCIALPRTKGFAIDPVKPHGVFTSCFGAEGGEMQHHGSALLVKEAVREKMGRKNDPRELSKGIWSALRENKAALTLGLVADF